MVTFSPAQTPLGVLLFDELLISKVIAPVGYLDFIGISFLDTDQHR